MVRNKDRNGDSYAEDDEDGPLRRKNPDEEWEQRTLCSDESCIGVLGPDGRCKECGRLHEEENSNQVRMFQGPEAEAVEEVAGYKEEKKSTQFDFEWEKRTLCSDEICIGVIGQDGRCKECGKVYERN